MAFDKYYIPIKDTDDFLLTWSKSKIYALNNEDLIENLPWYNDKPLDKDLATAIIKDVKEGLYYKEIIVRPHVSSVDNIVNSINLNHVIYKVSKPICEGLSAVLEIVELYKLTLVDIIETEFTFYIEKVRSK